MLSPFGAVDTPTPVAKSFLKSGVHTVCADAFWAIQPVSVARINQVPNIFLRFEEVGAPSVRILSCGLMLFFFGELIGIWLCLK